jgi:dTDP-4-amino-4,6-dideoxygalactose transaminase
VTENGNIPFLDLVAPHLALEGELVRAFRVALATAGFVGGPAVEEFERDFAQFCQARFCAGVSSGTDALRFALIAAGVRPGEIVVTVPLTFIATTEAITQAGAVPDFVDITPHTYTLDPQKLREYLERECVCASGESRPIHRKSGRTVAAVIPVHLYGQMADMDSILSVAAEYGLVVIEDACQAHGAEYWSQRTNRWMRAGSMARAAAFSFYPGKNLGACGEAGAVTTNDEDLSRKIRMLRDHGQARKYYHDMEGYNGRLDSIQAAFLNIKLPYLTRWNEERRERARRYAEMFAESEDVILPFEPGGSRAVYHLYVVRVRNREGLRSHLARAGIDTGIHYPIPLHLQKAYSSLGHKEEDFPVAEKAAAEILSLPMYPRLETAQQHKVVREILDFVSSIRLAPGSPSAGASSNQASVRQLL